MSLPDDFAEKMEELKNVKNSLDELMKHFNEVIEFLSNLFVVKFKLYSFKNTSRKAKTGRLLRI